MTASSAFAGNQVNLGSTNGGFAKTNKTRNFDQDAIDENHDGIGHAQWINVVGFSPDGTKVASGSHDKSLRIWDSTTGEEISKTTQRTGRIHSLVFSPDGSSIVYGSSDHHIWIYSTRTRQSTQSDIRRVTGHKGAVTALSYGGKGMILASGADDATVRLWRTDSFEEMRVLQTETSTVKAVSVSPDEKRVVSSFQHSSLMIWDIATGSPIQALHGHAHIVNAATYSPDGENIASSSNDQSISIWDAVSGQRIRVLNSYSGFVLSVAFSPDGSKLVSGSADTTVNIWDSLTGRRIQELRGHSNWVNAVAFSPDGNRVVSGSIDKSIRMWTNFAEDAEWDLRADGWIVSRQPRSVGQRLIWIPLESRRVLYIPHTSLIISRWGSASADFQNCAVGSDWAGCYTPLQ